MGKPSAPPPPDYAGAAQATAAGNLDAARATAAANRVNQITPQGTLNYDVTGKDPFGNPTWTATQTLAPDQQKLLDQQTGLSQGLLGTAQTGLDYANKTLASPGVDMSSLPQMPINAGQTYQDAMMQQLNPQIDRQQQMLDTKLANQGITQGSEAWKNAQDDAARSRNNLLAQATTQGMGMGLNAQNQAFTQAGYNQNLPINIINALRSGTQVGTPNYVNPAQQAQTAGPDLLGAANANYQGQMQGYNAQQAGMGNMMNGLFGLGSAAIMSDRRLKKNIKRVGTHILGFGIYTYDYIWGEKGKGVMADEVKPVVPEAVVRHPSGFDMVNYNMIGGAYAI